jgi:ribosomal protein S18 acetylase RimI-like enzyme
MNALADLHYRDAGTDDAAALAELGRVTFMETFGHLYRPEDAAAFLTRHSEQAWAKQLADPGFAVRIVEAGGKAVAFAKIGPNELPLASDRNTIELHQLYVLEAWQGHRIGRVLMDWILAESRRRGAEQILLSVWTQNFRAQAFYQSYGFAFAAPYAFMVGEQADEDEIYRLVLEPAS